MIRPSVQSLLLCMWGMAGNQETTLHVQVTLTKINISVCCLSVDLLLMLLVVSINVINFNSIHFNRARESIVVLYNYVNIVVRGYIKGVKKANILACIYVCSSWCLTFLSPV